MEAFRGKYVDAEDFRIRDIHIDFVNKTVNFKATSTGSLKDRLDETLSIVATIWTVPLLLVTVPILIIFNFNFNPNLLPLTMFILVFGPSILAALVIQRYRGTFGVLFPKFGYYYFRTHRTVKKRTFEEFLDKASKRLNLQFSNIYLEYEATEEYAKYLTDIKIVKHTHEHGLYNATFVFSNVPTTGKLKVKYL